MENISSLIYELIEQQSFDELSTADQKLVIKHMTKLEYETLRNTVLALKQDASVFESVNTKQKDNLMNHFASRKHIVRPLWNTPIQLWKAASILLLLGGGWLIHWQNYQHQQIKYVTQLDTIYLEKEIPIKIYDTVYYKDENNSFYASPHRQQNIPSNKSRIAQPATRTNEELIEPTRRGTSVKDDSLIQSFKFVTL